MSTRKYLVVVAFQLYWSYSKRAPVNLFEFDSRILHVFNTGLYCITQFSVVDPSSQKSSFPDKQTSFPETYLTPQIRFKHSCQEVQNKKHLPTSYLLSFKSFRCQWRVSNRTQSYIDQPLRNIQEGKKEKNTTKELPSCLQYLRKHKINCLQHPIFHVPLTLNDTCFYICFLHKQLFSVKYTVASPFLWKLPSEYSQTFRTLAGQHCLGERGADSPFPCWAFSKQSPMSWMHWCCRTLAWPRTCESNFSPSTSSPFARSAL